MKISHSYKLFAVTITLLLTIIGIIVFKALNIQDDVIRSEQHRFRSFLLAIELFQSSEDLNLTRMARSYVSTGKTIYEKRYFEILDIRNGKQPRPADYTSTYWHLAGVGRGPAIAQGETIDLQDLMWRECITQQESKLRQNILLAQAFIAITLCLVMVIILHAFRSILKPIEKLSSQPAYRHG
ncbi:MAG: hypothetical protein NTW65_11570 [Deltaproteobacteria bacterium]|nr:hypothetical protein [Deltaproteobacteria bacterium]